MVEAEAVLGDKAYDAQDRVIGPLTERGIEVVIPPKKNRKKLRNYDEYSVQSTSSDRKFLCQTQTVSSDRYQIQ
ncbi:MAG: transposase [Trichodesmium sp. MAG_R03]|nr:transposase [Trichodesmium sp. MAG_R03]